MVEKIRSLTRGPEVETKIKEKAQGRSALGFGNRKLLHDLEDARSYYPLNRINFDAKKLVGRLCDLSIYNGFIVIDRIKIICGVLLPGCICNCWSSWTHSSDGYRTS